MKRLSMFFSKKDKYNPIAQTRIPPAQFPLSNRICFPAITYSGHPLIWQLHKQQNMYYCTFLLAGTTKVPAREILFNLLLNIDGLLISRANQDAVIEDIEVFKQTYTVMNIYDSINDPMDKNEITTALKSDYRC